MGSMALRSLGASSPRSSRRRSGGFPGKRRIVFGSSPLGDLYGLARLTNSLGAIMAAMRPIAGRIAETARYGRGLGVWTSPRWPEESAPSEIVVGANLAPAWDGRAVPGVGLELFCDPSVYRLHAEKHSGFSMTQAKRRKWSGEVTEHSDALDLEPRIFKEGTAKEIALSLKHSAEASHRRKSTPFRAAMSMLTFYINRAGRNLSQRRRQTLDAAIGKLREAFERKR
jgi:hypothetical protein